MNKALFLLLPTVLGIVLLIWYICEKIRAYSMKALFIKTAVSLCFLATALCGSVFTKDVSPAYAALITGGLIFGLLGDYVLDLKYIDREREDLHTKSGFVFFGVGHVLFMLGMYLRFGRYVNSPWLFVLIALAAGFAAGYATAKCGPLFGNDYGDYFTIVALYSGILVSDFFLAAIYAVFHAVTSATFCDKTLLVLMSIGLASFLLSDLVLSRSYFGKDHHKPVDIILNYVFYYGAQFMIALSILFS